MDPRTAAIIAHTYDMARRSETDAMTLDRIYAACEQRAITPHESRELLRIVSEALRRSHQRDSLTLALFVPESLDEAMARVTARPAFNTSPSAPPAPPAVVPRVPWWRRWLRRVIG